MKKANVRRLIEEMDSMLGKPTLMLEGFMMPEEYPQQAPQDNLPMEGDYDLDVPAKEPMPAMQGDDVSADIAQIRQIAIKAIARLADNPNSKGYQLMKKIWNICDKETAQDAPDMGVDNAPKKMPGEE